MVIIQYPLRNNHRKKLIDSIKKSRTHIHSASNIQGRKQSRKKLWELQTDNCRNPQNTANKPQCQRSMEGQTDTKTAHKSDWKKRGPRHRKTQRGRTEESDRTRSEKTEWKKESANFLSQASATEQGRPNGTKSGSREPRPTKTEVQNNLSQDPFTWRDRREEASRKGWRDSKEPGTLNYERARKKYKRAGRNKISLLG